MILLHQHIRLADEAAMLAALPDWRRTEALRFRHALGRVQCAQSYLLLQEAFRQFISSSSSFSPSAHHLLTAPWQRTPEGKPYISALPHLHFNLSHCRDAVAVAVSDVPIGVDVESLGRYHESLARYVLSDSEFDQVQSSATPGVLFTRLWTQREAYAKCIGTGIIPADLPHLLEAASVTHTISTLEYIQEGYILSVCTPHNHNALL